MRKTVYLFSLILFTCIQPLRAAPKPFAGYADSSLILIPFQFQQSALYHAFTYEVIDSVAGLLLKNEAITLSIRGFAHADEGSDSVCKWLSEDRALFVKKYIMGRGVNESRIAFTGGMGAENSGNNHTDKNNRVQYFRAELVLNFPPPPPPVITDRDEDGILNEADGCPDAFGYADNKGCPDSNAFIIPFGNKEDWLAGFTYRKLDTLVKLLRQYPAYTISIQGHAHQTEGNAVLCGQLAANRAAVVKRYLLSRGIEEKRILAVGGFGSNRPLNAAKNPAAVSANCRVQVFIYPDH
jgi:outer membrane protein OmpA-like peptidoglycan-associated protein